MKSASVSRGALACALLLALIGGTAARAQEPAPAAAAEQVDVTAPQLALSGRRVQRLGPQLEAFGVCDERCEFDASARVHGVPHLTRLRVLTPEKAADGGRRMHFVIRVSPRAHKLMNNALRDGARVRVELNVLAYDMAENEAQGTRRIRVVPPGPPGPPPPPPA